MPTVSVEKQRTYRQKGDKRQLLLQAELVFNILACGLCTINNSGHANLEWQSAYNIIHTINHLPYCSREFKQQKI